MNVLKTVVLTMLLLLAVLSVYAEPQVSVTAIDSISIPNQYDYSMLLPNGDIQFYKMNYSNYSIQVYGFQYLVETHQITTQANLGTVTGFGELNMHPYSVMRFNKLYLIHDVAGGIAVITLDQNTLTSRIIYDFAVYSSFSISGRVDVVAEDVIVLAVDRLVYYNLIDGTYRTLLQGPEIWTILDSEGNILFTQSYIDYVMNMSVVGRVIGGSGMVNGKFYMHHVGIVEDYGMLECQFVGTDSLYLYLVSQDIDWGYSPTEIYPFGSDESILSSCHHSWDHYRIACYNSHIEQLPWAQYSVWDGSQRPQLSALSNDIITVSYKTPDYIAIRVLWTYDAPEVHEFLFPASSYAPASCTTYNYDNKLYVINGGKVYRFNVGVSSSGDDVVAMMPDCDLQVYPNPVRMDQALTIRSQAKKPGEIDIYNIKGQRIQTLQMDESGQLDWNLSSSTNPKISTGVYFIKQRDANHSKPKRFVLIK
jgi:hypothetical protein